MSFFDWGNKGIWSTATVGSASNPTTSTLINEIDSTQLGTQNLATGQSLRCQVAWIVGADTNAIWQLEQANSTVLSASTITITVRTPTGQSGQFVTWHELGPNDRLRVRLQSTFTGNATANIVAQFQT